MPMMPANMAMAAAVLVHQGRLLVLDDPQVLLWCLPFLARDGSSLYYKPPLSLARNGRHQSKNLKIIEDEEATSMHQ